jgi:uncharacterized protein YkwD
MERKATARIAARLSVWLGNTVVLLGILVAVQSASATVALAATHPHHVRRGIYVGVRRVASTASVGRGIYVGGRRVVASTASVHHGRAVYAELGQVESAKAAPQVAAPAAPPTEATASLTCANTNLIPTSANIPQVEAATLCLINQQRVLHHEHPLRDNADLDNAATQSSQDMVADNYYGDTTPAGNTAMDRVQASGYVPRGYEYAEGENIDLGALTDATPAAIVAAWMASPGHRENILDSDYLDSGIGIVPDLPADYASGEASATYTQVFAFREAPNGSAS